MSEVFEISKTSSENIESFIGTIEDNDLRELFQKRWEEIVIVGKLNNSSDASQQIRSSFFEDIKTIILKKGGGL